MLKFDASKDYFACYLDDNYMGCGDVDFVRTFLDEEEVRSTTQQQKNSVVEIHKIPVHNEEELEVFDQVSRLGHSFEYAVNMAKTIPGAEISEI